MGIDIHTALAYRDNDGKFHKVENYFYNTKEGKFDVTPLPYFRNSFFFRYLMDGYDEDGLKTLTMEMPECLKKWHEERKDWTFGLSTTTLRDMTDCLDRLKKMVKDKEAERTEILSKTGESPCIEFNERLLKALTHICTENDVSLEKTSDIIKNTREWMQRDYEENGVLSDTVTELEYEISEYSEHRDMLEFWVENITGYAYTWFEGALMSGELGYTEFNPSNLYVWYCFDN